MTRRLTMREIIRSFNWINITSPRQTLALNQMCGKIGAEEALLRFLNARRWKLCSVKINLCSKTMIDHTRVIAVHAVPFLLLSKTSGLG